ncbi:MAG: 2-C-methyl-D-erythritol 4-phosphate cytidylyltransferase [Planctomycetes bacterium]|nr:2-C-methyl-D-erythritol 4-phosphate cytidylyltransferase [Planctomycetota bacterium]
MLPPFAVILPAAGMSSRFGGSEKKPFVNLDGRAIWLRAAESFVTRPEVKQCIIVVSPEDMALFKQRYAANVMFLNMQVVEGGKERYESVANALAKLTDEIAYVAVHDAVRPCVPPPLIDLVFNTAVEYGAALPGIPVADTLKRVNPGMQIEGTVSRAGLYQVQTPQVFRRDWLVEAYQKRSQNATITDDAQLIEALGHPVHIVPGSPYNLKITTGDDLGIADLFVKHRKFEPPVKPSRPFEDERFS